MHGTSKPTQVNVRVVGHFRMLCKMQESLMFLFFLQFVRRQFLSLKKGYGIIARQSDLYTHNADVGFVVQLRNQIVDDNDAPYPSWVHSWNRTYLSAGLICSAAGVE